MNYKLREDIALYMKVKRTNLKWYKRLWNVIRGKKDQNYTWHLVRGEK